MEKRNKKTDFKLVKDNPESPNKNYIFQNNKITRVGFYIILILLVIGAIMVFVQGLPLA
ncbi:hypothetical protein [Tenacibaculum sp. IB213877]|uniref:hypothetical protein n=1 Tax=Tenacibaculum sp. IB213877 TaxID=3097351 RepID=UPI002A5AFC83|nr:hypothetical protein [Tenacibaculum sp. IB213877]MDY0779528.1 hypothetical protein [Tenacibaculum sp. IB213877]